jgi:Rrf2 family protein
MISKTCSHAIRASLYLASQSSVGFVPVKCIAEQLGISFHFLTKILQTLTARRILVSFRGPNGGVKLARPARSIKVREIVEAIDGADIFTACVLGLDQCSDDNPCPVHENWAVIRRRISTLFENTSLDRLAKRMQKKGLRLSDAVVESHLKRPRR